MEADGIHVITAATRPEAYESALSSLDRALAVNWGGDRFGPVSGIDFLDVPRVKPAVPVP